MVWQPYTNKIYSFFVNLNFIAINCEIKTIGFEIGDAHPHRSIDYPCTDL